MGIYSFSLKKLTKVSHLETCKEVKKEYTRGCRSLFFLNSTLLYFYFFVLMKKIVLPWILAILLVFQSSFSVFAQQENIPSQNWEELSEVLNSLESDINTKSQEQPKSSVLIAKKKALSYINNTKEYERWWKGKDPKPVAKPVPYHMDDINKPFIYEWKISCKWKKDCGAVTVAVIWNEARVLESSTYGKANFEILTKGKTKNKNKLYYFNPIEQYIESKYISKDKKVLVEVKSINPYENDFDAKKILTEKKAKVWKYRLKNKLQFSRDSKPSWKDIEVYSMTKSYPSILEIWPIPPANGCFSNVPCYDQFTQNYNGQTCLSWCAPTALAIIYGYYDRVWAFPNLLPWMASATLNNNVRNMVNEIRWYMNTSCNGNIWNTLTHLIRMWWRYAQNHWYPNSPLGTYSNSNVSLWMRFGRIKNQIRYSHPVVADFLRINHPYLPYAGHSVVVYWYNDTWNLSTSKIKINLWWGTWHSDKTVLIQSPINDNDPDLPGYKFSNITTFSVQ